MADRERGRFSQWRSDAIRGIDEAEARELAARSLERRGRSPDEVAARAAYLDLLGLQPGERVLDVGCGSGVVLRDVARRVAPGGVAVGLDPSPAMLTVARELADQDGLADLVDLREGDVRALPFEAAELDMLWRVRSRWQLRLRRVTGDTTYGTVESIVAVEEQGIRAYVPLPDFDQRTPFYGASRFTYNPERDEYRCPEGHVLRRRKAKYTEGVVYRAEAAT